MYGLEELMPYNKWRKGQLKIARAVYESVIKKDILLINFPTGAGKTLPVLIGTLKVALDNGYKVMYLARTRNQFQAPLRELRAINKKIGGRINFLILYNRQEYCILKELKKLSYEDFLRYCSFLRKNNRCEYYRRAVKLRSREYESFSYEDIFNIARKNSICPYEAVKNFSKNSNVIILTYNYIFDPSIREIFVRDFLINIKDSILVIDEAHNLPDVIRNILTKELRREWIYNAIREIKSFYNGEGKSEVILSLRGLYRYFKTLDRVLTGKKYIAIDRDSMYDVLPSSRDLKRISLYIESRYRREGLFKASYIRKIYEFIDYFYFFPQNMLYIEDFQGRVIIKSSSVFFGTNIVNPIKYSNATIMMSGTLPPKEYFITLIGLNSISGRVKELRIPSPLSAQVNIKIVRGISSRYIERSESLYRKIARYIDILFNKELRGVVLTVFPSYNFMKNVRLYTSSSPIVMEREKSKLTEIVDEVRKYEKALLYVVAGGKMVEGIEMRLGSKSMINTVIIAGLPVPEPNILLKNILENISLKMRNKEIAWKHVFYFPAVIKVIQAIGRSVRSIKDSAKVYILDERATDQYIIERLEDYGYLPEIIDNIT